MEDGDDDFGDLYADVEVEASSAMNTAPHFSQLEYVSGETGTQNSVLEANSDKEDRASDAVDGDDDDDDDDEDDLKIVLNSDDDDIGQGEGFTIARNNTNLWSGELGDEDDEDDLGRDEFVGGKSVGKGGSGGDGTNQSLIGGGKGVYKSHSQYKYVRSQSAVYASDLKGSGCVAAAYLSREDNGCCQRMGSRSMGPQSGQRFSLPRSRTILDVNIDTFEQKPWKHPGAEITDYFNFGLNEDTWKLYCNQVDEYRHRGPMPSGNLVSEPAQRREAYEGRFQHEMVAHEVWGKSDSRYVEVASSMLRMPSREQHLERRKGRAIQVEDSMVERQSSMDVMRQLNRDSDVIQIAVQDSGEHYSGYIKEGLGNLINSAPEASKHGDVSGDDATDHISFSSASDDESVEGNCPGMETDAPIRSSNRRSSSKPVTRASENHEIHQISDVDRHQSSRMAICGSEGTDEATRTSDNTKERVDEDTCTTDPSTLGAESSKAEMSPASRCKEFKDGTRIDRRKSYDHEIRPVTKSFTELSPSVKYGYHHSEDSRRLDDKRKHGDNGYHARVSSPVYRNHGESKCKRNRDNDDSYSRRLDERKPGDLRYHARHNSPVYNNRTFRDSKPKPQHGNDNSFSRRADDKRKPGEHRCNARHSSPVYKKRTHRVSKPKAHHEYDDSFRMSDIEGAYDVHSIVGHNRWNERLRDFDPYDEENISYLKESELPLDYYAERFSGYEDWDPSARDHQKGYERFGSKMHPFFSRHSEEEEYYGERRKYVKDHRAMATDRWHRERELAVDDEDFFADQDFGWQSSEYPPYVKHERGAQWQRRGGNLHFRNKGEDDEYFLERNYADHIQGRNFRRSLTYNGRERDHFERGCVEHVAYTKWEFRGPRRNKRRFGSSLIDLPKGAGDGYLRDREDYSFAPQSSEELHVNNSRWHGNMLPRNNSYGRRGSYRGQWTERFRDHGSVGGCSDPCDIENHTIDDDHHLDMGRTRRHWQSEMQWNEDEIMSRHGDTEFCAEGVSFPYEKVSRRKSFASEHGSDHGEELVDDSHVEGRKYKLRREGTNSDKFERTSNVICGGSREQSYRGSGDSQYSHLVEGSNHVEQTRELESGSKFDGTSNVTHGGSREWSFMGGESLDSHLADGSDHIEELIDDLQTEGYRYKQTREVISGNKCSRTSNVILRESHKQLSPSCRNSFNSHLVVGKGKPSETNDRAEWNADEPEKHTCRDFDSRLSDKVAQALQSNRVDEGLDIEEGQILTEELNTGPMKDDAGVHVNDVHELHNQNGNLGVENPRILEAMAKIEKRRARFKEPITTTKKDSDSTAKLAVVDLVQETTPAKQQRPARKRRWGGS